MKERQALKRRRKQMGWSTGRNRQVIKCGTVEGHKAHRQQGTKPCAACRYAVERAEELKKHRKHKEDAAGQVVVAVAHERQGNAA